LILLVRIRPGSFTEKNYGSCPYIGKDFVVTDHLALGTLEHFKLHK